MVKALSVDLRTRVLAAVAVGASHRTAAARFGVGAASVSRWRALEREKGDVRPHPLGGDRRSGRVEAQARPRVDDAMLKALARAFRWRRMLDGGVHGTLKDLARAKGVALSYVSRILRLTLLAPDIVEAILDGRQPAGLQLDDLLRGFPLEWEGQRLLFG